MLDGWLAIFTGPKLIDELRRCSDDELSAVEGASQVNHLFLPFMYTMELIAAFASTRCCS